MTSGVELPPGHWADGELPANVRVGPNSVLTGDYAFKRFRSRREPDSFTDRVLAALRNEFGGHAVVERDGGDGRR